MTTFARLLLAAALSAGLTTAARAAAPEGAATEGTKDNNGSTEMLISDDDLAALNAGPADATLLGQTASIPEPGHLAVYGLGVACLLYRRCRRPTAEAATH